MKKISSLLKPWRQGVYKKKLPPDVRDVPMDDPAGNIWVYWSSGILSYPIGFFKEHLLNLKCLAVAMESHNVWNLLIGGIFSQDVASIDLKLSTGKTLVPNHPKSGRLLQDVWFFEVSPREVDTETQRKKSTNGEKTSLIRFSWQDPAPMHMVNIPSNSAMNMPLVTVRWLLHQLYDQENLALLSALLNSHLGRVYTECYFFQAS